MIRKISNNDNKLLANTIGQPLKDHSIAIALYGYLFVKSLNFKPNEETRINKYFIYSALLHDIGKISSGFQNYIKSERAKNNNLEDTPMDAEASRPKKFEGPFHNEISWAYIANFIDFGDDMVRDIVRHSVYWHHPANCSDKEDKLRFENSQILFEKVKEDVPKLLNDIYIFVNDLFNAFDTDYHVNDFNRQACLQEPSKNSIDTIQPPDFFSHKIDNVAINARKQLCLNLLLEADRTVSPWQPDRLKKFLEDWKKHKTPSYKTTEKFPVSENLENNTKSKEQYSLAQKMANKKLSVCGVDPAGGKTSISLYWWHECNNEYPLMIALPRQNQVTGLFESLKSDCKRVYGNKKINMESVFNGKRQDDNWEDNNWKPQNSTDFLISDINIVVFDRFLSPYYKRSQSSEFLKMLRSHLILDEFHEFRALPKMIPSLKEILTIRDWLDSGVKTLMLSGTPEPSLLKLLCVQENNIFKRTELSSREKHKFKMCIKTPEETQQFFSDCLYSFLKVESCQKRFCSFFNNNRDKIKMIHSYFTVSDKKELLEDILREHGKDHSTVISDKSVITSKMLQSSYNLGFNKAIVELSQPYMDCQTAGRINRFENKLNAEMCFMYNEDSEKFFNEPWGAGFKEIHKNWKDHILSFIESNKGQAVSIRKLMQAYDNFWNEDNIKKSLEILEKKQEEAVKELNKYVPKRFFSDRKKPASLNSLFRGESQYLSACVVDDNGKPTDQLYDESLLNESRNWFIRKIKTSLPICLKSVSKCNKANKVKGCKVFEYNKHIKIFGFKAERPLLCSHINQEIDLCLSKNLRDEDNNSTNHRVYHKKFGLVKKDLLEQL